MDRENCNLLQKKAASDRQDRLRTRCEIIAQIVEARKAEHITQAELARRMGTHRTNICRLESGKYNPSLDFLIKVAYCLGKELKIQMI